MAAVCTPSPKKKLRREVAPRTDWAQTMSVFTKFQPGLGHDGVGLFEPYGTLTNKSLERMLDRVPLAGRTHVDVGAADGKVMLGALAKGAARTFGLEVAGASLTTKFDAMVLKVRAAIGLPENARAELKCDCDICDLDGDTVEAWLAEVFETTAAEREDVVLTAVWHGFNVEAKEALLGAIANSTSVRSFVTVGPIKKDFGSVQSVIDFLAERGCAATLAFDDLVSLAGSGENYHAHTFFIDAPVVVPVTAPSTPTKVRRGRSVAAEIRPGED